VIRNIALLLCLAAATSLLSCAGPAQTSQSSPAPTRDLNDADLQATLIVGADDGGKAAAPADDIRVKRVRYLLGNVMNQTKASAYDIAFGLDRATSTLEEKYGKRVTRQQLLEDINEARTRLQIKEGDKFADAILLWALLKYGK
jgi:hypothetical protein